jgi:hypothetical protein
MTERKGLLIGLGLALAGLVTTGAAAQTNAPAAFGSLVSQIAAFFPSLAGEVLEVKDKEVVVSVGRREGAQAGMEFSLFREGRELRHPKTGEVLGRAEQELGVAVVSQVSERYSVAAVAGGAGVRPGDRARIPAGEINLTVMALGSSGVGPEVVGAVYNELAEELGATRRFRVLSGDAFVAAAAQAGIPPERVVQGEGLAATAGRHRVRRLLVLWVKEVEAKPFVEARLFSFLPGRETTPLLTAGLFVPSSVKVTAAALPGGQPASNSRRFSANPQPPEAPRSSPRSFLARLLFGEAETEIASPANVSVRLREVARFGFPVLAMDVAVSPKDKVSRLVFTDGEKIYLYRIAGRALEPEWTYPASATGQVLSVQLADLNDDGVLEVVANRYSPQQNLGLTSFVLTTRDGKPSVLVQDLSQILFAVDATGDGVKRTLWLQRFNPDGFFAKGQAERYGLRDGRLVADGAVRLPRDFRATGATLSNIAGQGPRAVAYVDEQNRLAVATDGQEKWRSTSSVGGGGYLQLEVVRWFDRFNRGRFYSVEPMPLAVDLDGDGIEELLIPRNQVQGSLAVVFRSRAGYGIQTIHTGLEGIITGLGVIRGAPTPTLILSVVYFEGVMKKWGESSIILATLE